MSLPSAAALLKRRLTPLSRDPRLLLLGGELREALAELGAVLDELEELRVRVARLERGETRHGET